MSLCSYGLYLCVSKKSLASSQLRLHVPALFGSFSFEGALELRGGGQLLVLGILLELVKFL